MSPDVPDPWSVALIEQNRRWLQAWFLSVLGDPGAAEDLVQEVFAQALRSGDRYDGSRPFGAWLRGIGRNLLMAHLRQQRKGVVCVAPELLDRLDARAAEEEAAFGGPDDKDRRLAQLRTCLGRLTDRARQLVLLRYREDQSSAAIGERLAMTAAAVDMALSRARKKLAECVQHRAGAEA